MANYGYDSVGNLTNENGASRTYDAENRIVSATGGSYVYDGAGKRIKRTASGQTWCYVYGLGGELLAEYLSTTPTTASKQYGYEGGKLLVTAEGATLKWLVTDHLGSTRLELNGAGSVATRHDYLPFGEELFAGIRGSGQNGYEPPMSSTRQRFTGYERDGETGLDFAQARYYASVQGRFTSPDPLMGSAKRVLPQSWNRYSYVLNNPLALVDPEGLDWYKRDGLYTWFEGSEKVEGYEHVAIGPNGLKLTNVKRKGSFERYTGRNITLYNDGRRIVDNGAYVPVLQSLAVIPLSADAGFQIIKLYLSTVPVALTGGGATLAEATIAALAMTDVGAQFVDSVTEALDPNIFTQGDRDARKINPKRYEEARKRWEQAIEDLAKLLSKPNKTPADKADIERLKRARDKARDDMKKSEPHGIKGK